MTATTDRYSSPTAVENEFSILDAIDKFIARYVDCTDEQRHAAVLFCAATSAVRECATFPRFLICGESPGAGKTLLMQIMASLCANPLNGNGSGYDLIAALLEAHNRGDTVPVPVVYRDEISSVFGKDGYGGNRANPIGDVAREGYKRGASKGVSRRGVSERYSIFVPMIMTGLRTAVPGDIRTRCVVVNMRPGTPREYFDVRDSEKRAIQNGKALYRAVRNVADDIASFRVRNLEVDGLEGRKGEVWESLLAAAYALGGQRWLNYGVSAFRALALSESSKPELTDEQQLLQYAAELGPEVAIHGFVPTRYLSEELRRKPEYIGFTDGSLANFLSEAIPCHTYQRTLENGDRARGYRLQDILTAWEQLRPAAVEEWEMPEQDPFAATEEDDEWPEEFDDLNPIPLPPANLRTGSTGSTGTRAGARVRAGARAQQGAAASQLAARMARRTAVRATRKAARAGARDIWKLGKLL